MRSKKKSAFTRVLKIKTKEYTLDLLLNLKAKHSKMDNLMYTELKMQNYLKSENITEQEAQNLFRFRVGLDWPSSRQILETDTQTKLVHCVQ